MRVSRVGIGVSLFGSSLLALRDSSRRALAIHISARPALVAYREDASNRWRRLVLASVMAQREATRHHQDRAGQCGGQAALQRSNSS
jgi:hypothetical protein